MALRGLAGESLFAAAMGVRGLSQTLEGLDKAGKAIFVPDRRSKTTVRAAIRHHDAAVKRKREREVSVGSWNRLQQELKRAELQQQTVRERVNNLRAESHRLQRWLGALEDIGLRHLTQEALARGEAVVLPPAYSVEERRAASTAVHRISDQRQAVEARVDGPGGLVARVAALAVDEGMLEAAAAIRQLSRKSGAYRDALESLPKRRTERGLLLEQAVRLLKEIEPGMGWDDAHSLRLTHALESEVERLGQKQGRLHQSQLGLSEQLREVEAELARAEASLTQLPAALDVAGLGRAVTEASGLGELEQKLSDAAVESVRLEAEAMQAIEGLGHWHGTLQELESLQLPLPRTLNDYQEGFRSLQEEDGRLAERIREHAHELSRTEGEIVTLQGRVQIPSRAELEARRTKRDKGWRLVRKAWLGEGSDPEALSAFVGAAPLHAAYEQTVVDADVTADRIIEQSELSAKLEQLHEQSQKQRGGLQDLEEQRQALGPRGEALGLAWQALWSERRVKRPLSPEEMIEWVGRVGQVRGLAQQLRVQQASARKTEQVLTQHSERLRRHLTELGECGLAEECFGELYGRAKARVSRAEAVEDRRLRLQADVAERKERLSVLRGKLEAARCELTDWHVGWSKALRELGCGEELSVDQAADRVRTMREFFAKRDSVVALEAKQIRPMEEDTRAFEAEVKELVGRWATDLGNMPAAVAVEALAERLRKAELAERDRMQLQRQIDEGRDELEQLKQQHSSAMRTLERLCTLAGIGDPGSLAAVEAASERRQQQIAELEAIERRLLRAADGKSVEALIAATAGKSSDDLQVQLEELARQIEDGDQEREQLSGRVAMLTTEAAAVDGGAEAREADQEALSAVSDIFEQAQQFVRLRLAWHLLRRRIEKHREDNQDPMVARASELFARITCGSFRGLTLDYNDRDEPTIVGVREPDSPALPVEAFSKGTADQLYLALRLAYVWAQLETGEAMPLILDDILVDFDDARSQATLRLLGELARKTQVILLTHHSHVGELARQCLGPEGLTEHTLA